MSKTINLKEIAEGASMPQATEAPEETSNTAVEEPAIVIGKPPVKKSEEAVADEAVEDETPAPKKTKKKAVKLDLDDNNEVPEDLDNPYEKLSPADQIKYDDYKKELIKEGLTPKEAKIAMVNKIRKDFKLGNATSEGINESMDDIVNEAAEEAGIPIEKETVAVIEIDKKNATKKDLALTEEEHAKLETAKAIKLIVVEDEDLKTIKLDKYDAKHKSDYVKSIEGALSNYSIPLPMFGDFVTFKGAQIIQLASAVSFDDERLEESINKKASLVYEKMFDGRVLKKYDAKGKIKLSYDDFINTFPFQDLDLAIYGILVASSMEKSESTLTCDNCKEEFEYTYNIKSLLNLDDISDTFKERIDDILGNKSNPEALQELHDDMNKARRYKSPFTNNIYDISYPSVARASNILRRIDQSDEVMVYTSALAIYINKLYVYNSSSDAYIEILEDEIDLMLDSLMSIPDSDYKLLIEQIQNELMYTPKFKIKATCPHCGNEMSFDINVDNLVFLRAQDSLKEIRS